MNFSIDRTSFRMAAESAARVVDDKAAIAIMRNVLLRTGGNFIELYASDVTTSVATRLPAMVLEPGELLVSAKALLDAIDGLAKGELTFTASDTKATLKAGRRSMELTTLAAADYPQIGALPTEWASIPGPAFVALLSFARHAALTGKDRPHLCGVRFERVGTTVRATATNGHQLATTEVEVDGSSEFAFTMPNKLVSEAVRLAIGSELARVEFANETNRAHFRIGETTISSQLPDGAFPAIAGVIPMSHQSKARMSRRALTESVRAVMKVTPGTTGVTLWCKPGSIDVVAIDTDHGTGRDTVDCELEGDALTIGMNGGYLSGALDALSGDDVLAEMSGPLDPILLRSADGSPGFAVLMPVRI